MATIARVEALRRHLNRDGSLIRPALVRVQFDGVEPWITTLDAGAARDLAARLLLQARHADDANHAPINRSRDMIARLSPDEHEARQDLAAMELGG